MEKLASLKDHIDTGLFLRGLAVAGLLYILLFVVIWLQSDETIAGLEERLASQTVLIQHDTKTTQPPVASVIDPHAEDHATAETSEASLPLDKNTLVPAPIKGLFERTKNGTLPLIRKKDGMTPFKAYSRPFAGTSKPMIALLVDDYGLSDTASETALKTLPSSVTLLLSPYSNGADVWQERARKNGHEVWLDLPFENAQYPRIDSGPRVLLTTASLKQNEDTLIWGLASTTGYAGIAGSTDYVFDSAGAVLQPLMKFTFGRGLGFLELNPAAPDSIETIAVNANAPYAQAHVHINDGTHESSPLKKLEFIAQEKGYAIGVIKPQSASLRSVSKWLATLEQKGIELVPVSAIAGRGIKDKPIEMPVATPEQHAPAPHQNEHH